MTDSLRKEHEHSTDAEVAQATLHSVVTDGNAFTLIVRAAIAP